jgi:hypothetical protein
MKKTFLVLSLAFCAGAAFSDTPRILKVLPSYDGQHWKFSVTVLHSDTGWDHYADGWRIYAPNGDELGYRLLAHPHVNEQPFTRSLTGVEIPATIKKVTVVPYDSFHGAGDAVEVLLDR